MKLVRSIMFGLLIAVIALVLAKNVIAKIAIENGSKTLAMDAVR